MKNVENNVNDYFYWLMSRVGLITGNDFLNHKHLCSILFKREYYIVDDIPLEINRLKNGLFMRKVYEKPLPDDMPVNCLEVLVAMAIAIEDNLMYDYIKGDRTYMWFQDMLMNLGCWTYDDKSSAIECNVNMRLDTWLDRTYDRDGNGSPFPIPKALKHKDMRKENTWMQMQLYYGIKFDEEHKDDNKKENENE